MLEQPTTTIVREGSILALWVQMRRQTAGLTPGVVVVIVVVGVAIGSGVRPNQGFQEHRQTSFESIIQVRLSCYCLSSVVVIIINLSQPAVIIEC